MSDPIDAVKALGLQLVAEDQAAGEGREECDWTWAGLLFQAMSADINPQNGVEADALVAAIRKVYQEAWRAAR